MIAPPCAMRARHSKVGKLAQEPAIGRKTNDHRKATSRPLNSAPQVNIAQFRSGQSWNREKVPKKVRIFWARFPA
jgi:hypothetical protein